MNSLIEAALKKAKQVHQVGGKQVVGGLINVDKELTDLLHTETWSEEQLAFFHGWMKKLDVAKKHYVQYQLNWTLSQHKNTVSTDCYKLSLLLALNYLKGLDRDLTSSQILKTCNVIYKILDYIDEETTPPKSNIKTYLKTLIDNYRIKPVSLSVAPDPIINSSSVLPLTVLFWEGPIARAYLATIKQMGYKVRKIIRLVSSVDLIDKKPVGRFLPKSLRVGYAANKQFKRIFYWPNVYKSKNVEMLQLIQEQIDLKLGIDTEVQKTATQNHDLQQYTEEVESVAITGLKDKSLDSILNKEESELFLFTGGGIVPDNLLTLKSKRLIHVHPGFLPDIRGADCVLWSQLIANRLSASAFFLAPGIDVGDIILPFWLPKLNFKFPENIEGQVKYRLVYGFLDPWVRSYVLKQAIYSTNGLTDFNTIEQIESEGMTFHFMHEKMKQIIFGKMS